MVSRDGASVPKRNGCPSLPALASDHDLFCDPRPICGKSRHSPSHLQETPNGYPANESTEFGLATKLPQVAWDSFWPKHPR
jgi:hypothetical protein